MFCTQCGTQPAHADLFCSNCGSARHNSSGKLAHLGSTLAVFDVGQAMQQQAIPPGVKGWSWGAFLFNWIWAIGNNTWVGLLALIPYVNLPVMIWLGFKGREMAWCNRHWDSVAHFNAVQRRWSQWGLGLVGATTVMMVLLMTIAISTGKTQAADEETEAVVQMDDSAAPQSAS